MFRHIARCYHPSRLNDRVGVLPLSEKLSTQSEHDNPRRVIASVRNVSTKTSGKGKACDRLFFGQEENGRHIAATPWSKDVFGVGNLEPFILPTPLKTHKTLRTRMIVAEQAGPCARSHG